MKTKLEIIPGPYRVCEEKHDDGTLVIRSDPRGDLDVPGDLVVALIVGGAPEPYDRNTAALLAAAPKLRDALSAALDILDAHADEEAGFWGEGTPFANEAKEIFENARAALASAAPSNDQDQRRSGEDRSAPSVDKT